VYAAKAGRVLRAGTRSGYGNTIELTHPEDNKATVYAHLSRMLVSAGDTVSAGQQIGEVGNTGGAAGMGCHLHFEVHEGTTTNFASGRHRLDPAAWLTANGLSPAASSSVMLALRETPQDEWTDQAFAGEGGLTGPNPWLIVGVGAAIGAAVAWLVDDRRV